MINHNWIRNLNVGDIVFFSSKDWTIGSILRKCQIIKIGKRDITLVDSDNCTHSVAIRNGMLRGTDKHGYAYLVEPTTDTRTLYVEQQKQIKILNSAHNIEKGIRIVRDRFTVLEDISGTIDKLQKIEQLLAEIVSPFVNKSEQE